MFFGDCDVCNKYQFDDRYFIPAFAWDFYKPEDRKFKNNLEVIKDFLNREKESMNHENEN